jgi:hypothetical protein
LQEIIKVHGRVAAARARDNLAAMFSWARREGLTAADGDQDQGCAQAHLPTLHVNQSDDLRRNFYNVEKWTRDGARIDRVLHAGDISNLC